VDWIITDPPYPREFLPVYADLAATAARILRPGGSLLCMVGQSYLPQIVERLTEHLPRSAARAASATRRSVPPSSVR
jgi:site-specific DNA-methyltransferase (adenine-specific)